MSSGESIDSPGIFHCPAYMWTLERVWVVMSEENVAVFQDGDFVPGPNITLKGGIAFGVVKNGEVVHMYADIWHLYTNLQDALDAMGRN